MYAPLYMSPAIRTQIYLTEAQRRRIDEVGAREGKSLAAVVRDALDAYLAVAQTDAEPALEATYGSVPGIAVPPRDEWPRG